MSFTRCALLFLVAGGLAPALFAQAEDAPVGVPVRIFGGGSDVSPSTMKEITIEASVLPTVDVPYGDIYLAQAGTSKSITTAKVTARMEPGKRYGFSVESLNLSGITLTAVAPPGYQVEIAGMARRSYTMGVTAGGYRTDTIFVRVLSPMQLAAGRAGTATSIASGRIHWQVALGGLKNGGSAGAIALIDSATSASWSSLFTPAGLHYDSTSAEVTVHRGAGGVLRQIVAPEAAVDVVTNTEDASVPVDACDLKFYHPDQKAGSGFPYTFTGSAFVTYRVQRDGSDTKLKLTSTTAARTAVTTLERTGAGVNSYLWNLQDWNTASQTQLVEELRTWGGTSTNRTESVSLRQPGQTNTLSEAKTFQTYNWGEELVSSTIGTTNAVTTTYDYYTASSQPGSYGFVKSVSSTGGSWEAYTYLDAASSNANIGTVYQTFRPYQNSPSAVSFDPALGEVTTYAYAADAFGMKTRPTSVETKVNDVLTAKSVISYVDDDGTGYPVIMANGMWIVEATRSDYAASASSLTSVTRYYREDTADEFFRSQIHSVTRPDQVKQSFVYQRGTWNGSSISGTSGLGAGSASRTIAITGSSASSAGSVLSTYDGYDVDDLYLVDGKSTMTVTLRDARAHIVRTETHAWKTNAWNLVAFVNYTYDTAGQLTNRTASNGAEYSAVYTADRKDSETDEAGVTLSYVYDAAGRVDTATRAAAGTTITALTTKFAYNAAGQVTQQTIGHGLSETLVSSRGYDDAGRLTTESSPGPNSPITTTYSYSPGTRQVTVTLPNGGSRVETAFADGRAKEVTGSGVVPEYYTYEIQTGGVGYTRVNLATSGSTRKREAWTDWLGRTTKTSRPGFSGTSQQPFEEQSFYDSTTGRLLKTSRVGFANTLYAYDALSQPTRSGLDLGANDMLDLASADRIADADQYFETLNSAWWLTKISRTYPTNGSGTALVISTTRQRLTGFAEISSNLRAEVTTTDLNNNTSTRTTSVDRTAKTTTVSTTTSGLANTQTETFVNGFATSVTGFDGLTFTSGYDALGRRSTTTDSRAQTTTTAYKPNSTFVEKVTDPAANIVATYTYDGAGRVIAVADASNQTTYTAYNDLDQIVRQWGSATYPVEYGYNAFGERETMKTFRDAGITWTNSTWPANSGAADWTRWEYDAPSGLLTAKYDAANLNATTGLPIAGARKVSFTYNVRGQTATRIWARDGSITTTYGYDGNTGELLTQSYSGGPTTPGVTYVYNRAGQLDTVTDATGTRTFNYGVAGASPASHALELDSITLGAFYNSRVLTQKYDAVRRPGGFKLGSSYDSAADLSQIHTYNTLGRFDNVVSASSAQAARTFSYTYKTDTSLVETLGIASSPFLVTRGYDANRNLLTSIEATWSAPTTVSRTRYDYTYNSLGQRRTAKQSGDVFADFGGSTYYRYAYNGRGEVTEAVDYQGEDANSTTSPQLTGRRFGYNYDPIGNRTSTTRALGTSVTDLFTTNERNQYTSRENDVAYVAGTARADSTVTVAGGTATSTVGRAGRYWGAEVTLNNTSGPAKADLTATATLAGTPPVVRQELKTAYAPAAQQVFTYDDDGNLTGDGLWTYTYDAENRLVTMTATAGANSALSAGFADRLLEFKYDYLGRRVQKRSSIVTANGGFTPVDTFRRYLYDGWNLVAEFEATSTTCGTLLRSFTWGLDLAGSLTATGGVGGLVQIVDGSTAYFPTYDGNGNVAALLRASDGAVVAKYEYSPFGELLRAEGAYALANPFRFSTKFTDDESGLVYYGHRYYSPNLGRFINRDPIAEQGGLNLYGFCGNDGVNHWDYLGQSWFSKAFRSIGKFLKKYWKPILAIVASVVTYGAVSALVSSALNATTMTVAASGAITVTASGSGLMAASLAAASGTIGGIVGGAAAGLVAGGITTGTVKGALQGAAAGAITGGVAGYYGQTWTAGRVATTSIAGGVASEVSGGSFRQGALISGAVSLVTYGAIKMREFSVAQSKLDGKLTGDASRNATKDSVGFNGDEFGAGGGRFDERIGARQIESELGGFQGKQGSIRIPLTKIRWEYSKGSFSDRLVEAYSGVHDFFNNPWSYNPQTGNYNPPVSIFGRQLERIGISAQRVASVMNWVDVPLTTPIVATSVIQIYAPNYISIYNQRGGD